jgi:hypothetical protein
MKFNISTKITQKYDILFEAPDLLSAHKLEDRLKSYIDNEPNPQGFPAIVQDINPNINVQKLIVRRADYPSSTTEIESMESDAVAIREEIESWNWNLNIFEIYDKLKDEFTTTEQTQLIKYALEYFNNSKEYTDLLQTLADQLELDLDDEDEIITNN